MISVRTLFEDNSMWVTKELLCTQTTAKMSFFLMLDFDTCGFNNFNLSSPPWIC